MAKPSRMKLLHLTLLALVLIAVALVVHNNRSTRRMASQLYQQARSSATAATTVDDARDWLVANGFHVVTNSDGVWISSYYKDRDADPASPPDALMVRGHRCLRGFLPIGQRWVAIVFQFYPNGTFERVLFDADANAPPVWSQPTTAPSTTAPVSGA